MVVMFKKSSKANLRKRRDTDEDEPGESILHPAPSIKPTTQFAPFSAAGTVEHKKVKTKKVKKVASSASVLSFGADEEEEEFLQIKKSSRSKRIAKQIKKRAQEEKELQSNGKPLSTASNNNIQSQPNEQVHVFRPKPEEPPENIATKSQQLSTQFSSMSTGAIPTPNMIHAARKQREMLRKFGSEFIPTDDTQVYKENKSRLVREDDLDNSSEDEILEMKGIEKQKPRQLVPNESDESGDENDEDNVPDEEVNRWEEEMIKKGINAQAPMTNNSHAEYYYQNQDVMYNQAFSNMYYGQIDNIQQAHHVNAKTDVSFATIKKQLEDHIISSREQHSKNQAEMDRLIFDTSECTTISKHLSNTDTLALEYKFYQETRQYLRDLVGCLQEKDPEINRLYEATLNMWQVQTRALVKRRIQDVQDEAIQSSQVSMKPAERNQAMDSEFMNRVREREARRTRRRAFRQIKKENPNHNDGMSSDDEPTSMEQAKFATDQENIQASFKEMFEDVIDDFCNVKDILQRFSDWRNNHQETYLDAYIALCIPKLIIPFVKTQLTFWNPLLSADSHFEDMSWFKAASMFALEQENLEGMFADDAKVISSVVEKVVLAKLTRLAQGAWDPMSAQQTSRFSAEIRELMCDYSFMNDKNRHCQHLIQAICKSIQNTLENDVFIPLIVPSAEQSVATLFLERQTWSCIKLFKNIMMFDGILSYKVLCEFAFDSLLNRYIMLALQTSALNVTCLRKCQEIIRAIPRPWFKEYEDVSTHLTTLSRLLVHLSKALDQTGEPKHKKEIKVLLFSIGDKEALSQI